MGVIDRCLRQAAMSKSRSERARRTQKLTTPLLAGVGQERKLATPGIRRPDPKRLV